MDIIDIQIGDDRELRELVERETVNARVAQAIYDARKQAGLSQRELAELVGTSHSTIVRLEDADYTGHSLPCSQELRLRWANTSRSLWSTQPGSPCGLRPWSCLCRLLLSYPSLVPWLLPC